MRSPLIDTSDEAWTLQVDLWRQMAPAQRIALVGELNEGVKQLAMAGIRQRHPGADARECFLRYARLTLGAELALSAYPELAELDD